MSGRGYRFAVAWIAANDESRERDPEVIATLPSLLLVADMFGKEPERVARDVLRVRERDYGLQGAAIDAAFVARLRANGADPRVIAAAEEAIREVKARGEQP